MRSPRFFYKGSRSLREAVSFRSPVLTGIATDSYKAVSDGKGFVHTVLLKNKLYYEIPRMDQKRNDPSRPSEEPQRKIRKIINMSPAAKHLLKTYPDMGAARLHIRQEGDEVFISIRIGVGDNVQDIPIIPRDQRPRKPKRSAGH